MPRRSRINAPGAIHHIIARGIDRQRIFQDNADRDNFLDRLNPLRAGIVKGRFLSVSINRHQRALVLSMWSIGFQRCWTYPLIKYWPAAKIKRRSRLAVYCVSGQRVSWQSARSSYGKS